MLNKSKTTRVSDAGLENTINRIVEGTRFKGEISSEGNIRIDGTFIGEIESKGRIVIGPQGVVEGTVRCQNCDVEGRLKGKLGVEELLTLKSKSSIEGEVHYGQLGIEPGAKLSGTLHMGGKIKDLKQVESKERLVAEQTA